MTQQNTKQTKIKDWKNWLSTISEKEKESILDRINRNPFLIYKPHPTQQEFHYSKSRIRAFFGGNRSGKTRALIQEVIWYGTGLHPYKKIKTPVDIWVVSLDFPLSHDVVQPMIRKILGSGYLKSWRETDRSIELTNGSTIGFKSVDSGWEKFQGTSKHLIAFDEEPKYNVWQECRMRVVSTKGDIIMAMTPLHGMTWVYDELYEPWMNGGDEIDTECFIAATSENPYIDTREIERIVKTFDVEQQKARLGGNFIEFAGLIYKEFNKKIHVCERFPIPEHWIKIRGIDPGLNNPTAVLWWAVAPDDEHYIYDEYYETDKTIREFATEIKSKTGLDKISHTVIDPASCARNPAHPELRSVREEYSKNGIWTKPANNDVTYGINAVKELLRVNDITGNSKLHIFSDLVNTRKEMMRYRWETHRHHSEEKNSKEKPAKVMDHLMDAMRYIAASKPRYVSGSQILDIAKINFKPTDS